MKRALCRNRLAEFVLCAAIAVLAVAGCSKSPTQPDQAPPISSIDASDGDFHDRVVVLWDTISGAATYCLLRSSYPDSVYTTLAGPIDSLRFDDRAVTVGSYYDYMVVGFNASGSSVDTTPFDRGFASVASALGAPQGLAASDGTSGSSVEISWESVSGAAYYRIFRSKTLQGEFSGVGGDVAGLVLFDTAVQPGFFYYTVAAFTSDGIEGAHSDVDSGYRSITNREFFYQLDTTIMRSNSKITLLGELGEETVAGDVTGTCHYKTEIRLMSGRALATITYDNYSDFYLLLNGSSISNTDFGGNGELTGTVTMTGIYPGSVEYHLTISNKVANGGYYRMCQTGGGCEDLQYVSVK